jgi:hypothetical protein
MPTPKYLEIYHLHWSPEGGNVVFVVPMGDEAFRSEQDLLSPGVLPAVPRCFRYRSSRSTAALLAPNGLRVAVIELAEADKQIELVKGRPKLVELGLLTMRIEPGNLIAGVRSLRPRADSFVAPTWVGPALAPGNTRYMPDLMVPAFLRNSVRCRRRYRTETSRHL